MAVVVTGASAHPLNHCESSGSRQVFAVVGVETSATIHTGRLLHLAHPIEDLGQFRIAAVSKYTNWLKKQHNNKRRGGGVVGGVGGNRQQ